MSYGMRSGQEAWIRCSRERQQQETSFVPPPVPLCSHNPQVYDHHLVQVIALSEKVFVPPVAGLADTRHGRGFGTGEALCGGF